MIVGEWRLDSYWGVVCITVIHTHTAADRLLQLSSVGLGSMSLPGDASLVCIPPADELTAGDHHRAVKMNPLVLDGGVL